MSERGGYRHERDRDGDRDRDRDREPFDRRHSRSSRDLDRERRKSGGSSHSGYGHEHERRDSFDGRRGQHHAGTPYHRDTGQVGDRHVLPPPPPGPTYGGQAYPQGQYGPLQHHGARCSGSRSTVYVRAAALDQAEARNAGLSEQMKGLGLQDRPVRETEGTLGRPIAVAVNHFAVKYTPLEVRQWNVTITKEELAGRPGGPSGGRGRGRGRGSQSRKAAERPLPPPACRAVIAALAEREGWHPGYAFDGQKTLYAPTSWNHLVESTLRPFAPIKVEDEGRMRSFRVTTAHNVRIDIADLDSHLRSEGQTPAPSAALQVLDVAIKHALATRKDVVTTPGGFFFEQFREPPAHGRSRGASYEILLGQTQALRIARSGLQLNVNLLPGAFRKAGDVATLIEGAVPGWRRDRALEPRRRRDAEKAVAGLKILLDMPIKGGGSRKRSHKARGITEQGADRQFFDRVLNEESRPMSVAQYYYTEYGCRLREPHLPCIDVGTKHKPVWLPMELCTVVRGQALKRGEQPPAAEMLKMATKLPGAHRAAAEARVKASGFGADATLREFGLSVEGACMQFEARVLPAPDLLYGNGRRFQPRANKPGEWNMNGLQFHTPAEMHSYAMVNFDPSFPPEAPNGLLECLLRKLRALGVQVPSLAQVRPAVQPGHEGSIMQDMQAAVQGAMQAFRLGPGVKPSLILVLLPQARKDIVAEPAVAAGPHYDEVKRVSDSSLGIPSQCLATENLNKQQRKYDQYCANLAMKINAKLGGVNQVASLPHSQTPSLGIACLEQEPFIIFGADVTHPTGFSKSEPSIAALVGSMDPWCGQWASVVRSQGHRLEIIEDLKTMVKDLLLSFYLKQPVTPKRLIFFRDGVSEGELATVQRLEIPQIRAACEEIEAGYSPPITFIVVRKRHGTRMYPAAAGVDPHENLPPGTVLDRGIVSPREQDFFLISQAAKLGTSRPAHYHTILNQNELSFEDVQRLSYTVGVCVPAYYAHLAAKRGRAMLTGNFSDTASVASGASRTEVDLCEIHPDLITRMHYV